MTLFQLSILGNIVLGIIVVIFAIDRANFQRTCRIRHNPIDAAIIRIEDTLNALHKMFVEYLAGGKK